MPTQEMEVVIVETEGNEWMGKIFRRLVSWWDRAKASIQCP